MIISEGSCAIYTRTIASLTSSNVLGLARIRESAAWTILLWSDTHPVQTCAYRFIPQLLPNIRRRVAERCCVASGQVGVQGEEDRWAAPRKQVRSEERGERIAGRDADGDVGFQQENPARKLAPEGEYHCGTFHLMFSVRPDCGYLPYSFRSLQRTTCSYTALHDVRRDPGRVDRQLCRRRDLLLTLRSSCRVCLFACSLLQYILRSPLFTFLALGTLNTTAIAHRPLFHLFQLKTSFSPYTVFKRHTLHFWTLAPAIFLFRSPLLYSPRLPHSLPFSPARVRISQCRVFRLTRQEVRKRRITIRICIFLEASSEIVVGRNRWKYRGCATQSTDCARLLLPVCCNRGNFGDH